MLVVKKQICLHFCNGIKCLSIARAFRFVLMRGVVPGCVFWHLFCPNSLHSCLEKVSHKWILSVNGYSFLYGSFLTFLVLFWLFGGNRHRLGLLGDEGHWSVEVSLASQWVSPSDRKAILALKPSLLIYLFFSEIKEMGKTESRLMCMWTVMGRSWLLLPWQEVELRVHADTVVQSVIPAGFLLAFGINGAEGTFHKWAWSAVLLFALGECPCVVAQAVRINPLYQHGKGDSDSHIYGVRESSRLSSYFVLPAQTVKWVSSNPNIRINGSVAPCLWGEGSFLS